MIFFFFFNDTATTEIYTLSLHDALPISQEEAAREAAAAASNVAAAPREAGEAIDPQASLANLPDIELLDQDGRSEEHTSELQSRQYLVCRLLLEKKKKNQLYHILIIQKC